MACFAVGRAVWTVVILIADDAKAVVDTRVVPGVLIGKASQLIAWR